MFPRVLLSTPLEGRHKNSSGCFLPLKGGAPVAAPLARNLAGGRGTLRDAAVATMHTMEGVSSFIAAASSESGGGASLLREFACARFGEVPSSGS